VVVLTVVVTLAMFGPRLRDAAWPAETAQGLASLGTGAMLGLALLALYAALRQAGPVVIGRADAFWLLTAPLPRRALLLPGFVRAATGAAVAGALIGLAGVGNLAARPVPAGHWACAGALGAGVGVLLTTAAAAGQRRQRVGRVLDRVAIGALLAFAAVLITDGRSRPAALTDLSGYAEAPAWFTEFGPATQVVTAVVLVAAALVAAWTGWTLDRLPAYRIQQASVAAGAFLDAAYAAEPSFVLAPRERGYWSGRALRSVPLRRLRGLPALARQDLLVLGRYRRRQLSVLGAALLPLVLADGPAWLVAGAVLFGGLYVAGTTLDAVRQDADHPALIRLLGLTGRRVIAQRLLVPGLLATVWCGLTLAVLAPLAPLPPGPWWALGLALGPAVAVAAAHRARSGPVNNDLPLVITPMGAVSPGPIIWALTGADVLVPLGLPAAWALIAYPVGLSWWWVLAQAVFAGLGAVVYLLLATSRRRGEL
jgi:hypothetical protein